MKGECLLQALTLRQQALTPPPHTHTDVRTSLVCYPNIPSIVIRRLSIPGPSVLSGLPRINRWIHNTLRFWGGSGLVAIRWNYTPMLSLLTHPLSLLPHLPRNHPWWKHKHFKGLEVGTSLSPESELRPRYICLFLRITNEESLRP